MAWILHPFPPVSALPKISRKPCHPCWAMSHFKHSSEEGPQNHSKLKSSGKKLLYSFADQSQFKIWGTHFQQFLPEKIFALFYLHKQPCPLTVELTGGGWWGAIWSLCCSIASLVFSGEWSAWSCALSPGGSACLNTPSVMLAFATAATTVIASCHLAWGWICCCCRIRPRKHNDYSH